MRTTQRLKSVIAECREIHRAAHRTARFLEERGWLRVARRDDEDDGDEPRRIRFAPADLKCSNPARRAQANKALTEILGRLAFQLADARLTNDLLLGILERWAGERRRRR